MTDNEFVYAAVNNIPWEYHSRDLRNFFSQFLESDGFYCFHFKHRPEVAAINENSNADDPDKAGSTSQNEAQRKRTCCVIQVRNARYNEFVRLYHRKHWLNSAGEAIRAVCRICKITVTKPDTLLAGTSPYRTRLEQRHTGRSRQHLTPSDLATMQELNPPRHVMPRGNVGTSTRVFLNLVNKCILPPAIIKNLGLVFPRQRARRLYASVPLKYPGAEEGWGHQQDEEEEGESAGGDRQSCDPRHQESSLTEESPGTEAARTGRPVIEIIHRDRDRDQEGEDVEEWERHEALHDDPADVERNKEHLYEDVIELQWEKGGPGLVFYTDAQYWKQDEGDFDEQTADDWDVDMSAYYEDNGGDTDARHYITMRRDNLRRQGQHLTLDQDGWIHTKTGTFEKYTKGIGRKVMEKQGWTEGSSLGSSEQGLKEALDNDGKKPGDRRGLGFYGEKINRYCTKSRKRTRSPEVRITTIYDDPLETDPQDELLRRQHHHIIKHRLDQSHD